MGRLEEGSLTCGVYRMLEIRLADVRRVLCLGAHSDDLEIGCGGTLCRIIEGSRDVVVRWHVFSAAAERRREAERSATRFLEGARDATVHMNDFRESYFPEQWAAIKDVFETIKAEFEPDVVLTHWRDDRHQDHRVLSDLAWNTFRSHAILEYEIPKYDGDLGNPNIYVALDEALCRRKVDAIMDCFQTQRGRHWFTEDVFWGLLRLRGMECGPRARYAEAFFGRKLVV
jgi:LmbE family N-acetylglucosaminyl deacetylase